MSRSAAEYLRGIAVAVMMFALPLESESASSCYRVGSQPPNSTTLWGNAGGGDEHCFGLAFDAPGIMTLDVTTPLEDGVELRVELYGPRCDGAGFRLLERTAAKLTAEIEAAGEYYFCAAADAPAARIDRLRVRSAFVSRSLVDPPGPRRDRDEDEPDPDPLLDGSVVLASGIDLRRDRDEDEPDPDPLAGTAPWRLVLCQQSTTDDHGDGTLCATPIRPGMTVEGVIDDGATDIDMFILRLESLTSIQATARGRVSMALYDSHGYRLSSGTIDADGKVRVVKTLVPGRYYLRLESRRGARGDYRLSLAQQGG